MIGKTKSQNFRNVSLLGIGIVPACYMIGFLIWSLHAKNEMLGALPLNATQYLGAGAVALVLGGVMTATSLILKTKWDSPGNKAVTEKKATLKRLILDVGTIAAGILVAGILLMLANTIIPWFDVDNPFSLLAIFCILGLGMLIIYVATYGVILFIINRRTSSLEDDLKNLIAHRFGLGFSLLAFLAFFSMILLPIMNPEFGGAQQQGAALDLDPDDLSSETQAGLWPDWELPEDRPTIVRTPEFTVAFINDDWILAKSMDDSDESTYTIDRSIVKTLVWS